MSKEMEKTFHRRELPPPAVAFSSVEGKALFKDSLEHGTMEGYFRLAEHYVTQGTLIIIALVSLQILILFVVIGHPAFCGIGSLTMALNSLLLDPQRVWQGVWRWFDESMLTCCEPLDIVRLKGITLPKLGCLARCNGAITQIKYGSDITMEEFRNDITLVTTLPENQSHTVMVVSYSRGKLKQSGSGHFSPIGKNKLLLLHVICYDPYHFHCAMLIEQYLPMIINYSNAITNRCIQRCQRHGSHNGRCSVQVPPTLGPTGGII